MEKTITMTFTEYQRMEFESDRRMERIIKLSEEIEQLKKELEEAKNKHVNARFLTPEEIAKEAERKAKRKNAPIWDDVKEIRHADDEIIIETKHGVVFVHRLQDRLVYMPEQSGK